MIEKIKEIDRPSFRLVRNGEHYNYHTKILNVVTPIFAKEYKMEDLRYTYEKLFRKEDEAFMRNRGFEETKEIQAADHKRDELFFFIKRFIENMKYNPDPHVKEAGKELDKALDPYRNAHRKSLQENTILMDSFIKEMEKKIYYDSLKKLDLIKPLQLLKEANESFLDLYKERSMKKEERNMKDKLKQLRPQVDQAFFEMVKFINAIYLVSYKITKEDQVTDELSEIIDKINIYSKEMLDGIEKRRAEVKKKPSKGVRN